MEFAQNSEFGEAMTCLYFRNDVFDNLTESQCHVYVDRGHTYRINFSLEKDELEKWIRRVDQNYGDLPEVRAFLNYIRLKIQEPTMAA
jgi:hypothetical protein